MLYVLIYLISIVAANLAIAHFGASLMPLIAFFFIGLDLSIRDKLHDAWQARSGFPIYLLVLIAGGSALTYLVNPASGAIALASAVSFFAAFLADSVVYHLLKDKSFLKRSNGSNVAGAAVDSALFPTLAFGVFMPWVIAAQLAAKTLGGALWSYLLDKARNWKVVAATAALLLMLVPASNAQPQTSVIASAHYDVARQAPIGSVVYQKPLPGSLFLNGFVEAWYNPPEAYPPKKAVLFSKHWISYPLTRRLSVSTEVEISRNMAGAWARFPEPVPFEEDRFHVQPKVGISYRIK